MQTSVQRKAIERDKAERLRVVRIGQAASVAVAVAQHFRRFRQAVMSSAVAIGRAKRERAKRRPAVQQWQFEQLAIFGVWLRSQRQQSRSIVENCERSCCTRVVSRVSSARRCASRAAQRRDELAFATSSNTLKSASQIMSLRIGVAVALICLLSTCCIDSKIENRLKHHQNLSCQHDKHLINFYTSSAIQLLRNGKPFLRALFRL
mgnify:CR=1 FL=1